MATAVASRFACLTIEDDDENTPQKPKNPKKKKVETKQKPPAPAAKPDNAAVKKKQKKKKQNNSEVKKKANDQWEQWKQKDNEFVDESYEQDLQQAILLSKLDYEEKKPIYDKNKKEEEEKKGPKKKEKKKTQPMSLEQFNSLDPDQIENIAGGSTIQEVEEASAVVEPDQTFFDRIEEDTKKVLDREQRLVACRDIEPLAQEAVTISHYKDLLKDRDKEILSLKEEVETLKEELLSSKKRYKKFCNLLASAEMCDKAKVLADVERLQKVRDELSAEVSSLHAQLEQERSKVRTLTSELKKSQNKKRTASETAQ